MRTPQSSIGGVGVGAAGVSMNSKSSDVSDADLTIFTLSEITAMSSVIPCAHEMSKVKIKAVPVPGGLAEHISPFTPESPYPSWYYNCNGKIGVLQW